MSPERIHEIKRLVFCRPIVMNSLKISAIVGTVLNLINQGHYLIKGEDVMMMHLVLNYVVPYIVSTTSAIMTQMKQDEMREFTNNQSLE